MTSKTKANLQTRATTEDRYLSRRELTIQQMLLMSFGISMYYNSQKQANLLALQQKHPDAFTPEQPYKFYPYVKADQVNEAAPLPSVSLLLTNSAFLNKVQTDALVRNRHDNDDAQHAYDNQFALTCVPQQASHR